MATFDDFWVKLKADLITFAEQSWKAHKDAAISDGTAFLEQTKGDLARWTALLVEGKLTPKDVEWLMAGKKDVAELAGLKQLGLAQVERDRFVNGIVQVVTGSAAKVFLA